MAKRKQAKAHSNTQALLPPVLHLKRLFAEQPPLVGDDVVYALTDGQGNRVLREDGNFDDLEAMPAFRMAREAVGDLTDVQAVTSAYLNSPRRTYWLMVSALWDGQPLRGILPVTEAEQPSV